MAVTAVLNKETNELLKVAKTAEEKKEFDGREDVKFVTSKNFEPTEQFKSWEEMIGKVKPAAEGDAAPAKAPAVDLSGPYYILKPFPNTAHDHPKWPIWEAIIANNGKTCEEAKAACPAENPKRKTSGVYTFASEFRYFLKAGYVALGVMPEGYDFTQHGAKKAEAPAEGEVKEKKAKKSKKAEAPAADAAQNDTDAGQPQADAA